MLPFSSTTYHPPTTKVQREPKYEESVVLKLMKENKWECVFLSFNLNTTRTKWLSELNKGQKRNEIE